MLPFMPLDTKSRRVVSCAAAGGVERARTIPTIVAAIAAMDRLIIGALTLEKLSNRSPRARPIVPGTLWGRKQQSAADPASSRR